MADPFSSARARWTLSYISYSSFLVSYIISEFRVAAEDFFAIEAIDGFALYNLLKPDLSAFIARCVADACDKPPNYRFAVAGLPQ